MLLSPSSKGAPVEWRPWNRSWPPSAQLAHVSQGAQSARALLFIDYLLSKEGQQFIMKGGLWSPRDDIGSLDQKFKKSLSRREVLVDEYEMETKLGQLFGNI